MSVDVIGGAKIDDGAENQQLQFLQKSQHPEFWWGNKNQFLLKIAYHKVRWRQFFLTESY